MQTVKQALVESECMIVVGQIRCDGCYDDQIVKEKNSYPDVVNRPSAYVLINRQLYKVKYIWRNTD